MNKILIAALFAACQSVYAAPPEAAPARLLDPQRAAEVMPSERVISGSCQVSIGSKMSLVELKTGTIKQDGYFSGFVWGERNKFRSGVRSSQQGGSWETKKQNPSDLAIAMAAASAMELATALRLDDEAAGTSGVAKAEAIWLTKKLLTRAGIEADHAIGYAWRDPDTHKIRTSFKAGGGDASLICSGDLDVGPEAARLAKADDTQWAQNKN